MRLAGTIGAFLIFTAILAHGQDRAMDPPPAREAAQQQLTVEEETDYLLRRGDELEIKVLNLPELSGLVTVRPDGKISALLLQDVVAAGTTPMDLAERIRAGYSVHYRDPQVTVVVRSFTDRNIYVGGEVAQPGLVPLPGRMTVLASIMRAGGFKESATLENVFLVRDNGSGVPIVAKLDLKKVLEDGLPDVALRPFDVVYVPKSKIATANKFMTQYVKEMLPISFAVGFSYILGGIPF